MRPLVAPAPHPVGQALYVGGALAEIARVAGEDDLCPVLVVGSIDDSPPPVIQREGADAGAGHHWGFRQTETPGVIFRKSTALIPA